LFLLFLCYLCFLCVRPLQLRILDRPEKQAVNALKLGIHDPVSPEAGGGGFAADRSDNLFARRGIPSPTMVSGMLDTTGQVLNT
jgi:hypothetical protein